MKPSLRFLALVVVAWTGFRAATLGALPGAEIFRIDRSEAKPPPIAPTEFPPIEPIAPATAAAASFTEAGMSYAPQTLAAAPRTVILPVYYPASSPSGGAAAPMTTLLPEPRRQFYSAVPALDEWPLSRIAAASTPILRSTVVRPAQSIPVELKRNGIDRLQLTTWALLRS